MRCGLKAPLCLVGMMTNISRYDEVRKGNYVLCRLQHTPIPIHLNYAHLRCRRSNMCVLWNMRKYRNSWAMRSLRSIKISAIKKRRTLSSINRIFCLYQFYRNFKANEPARHTMGNLNRGRKRI
ncbi:uncharacterized protein LOC119638923 [Glossina fuscipes]|uniref:Uncharacterized protein LOC119638923 n=1 Tax=Glossina fuscipes TaxID=7396 RepID=A0A9C5Z8P7_9MUSC|nr:uncharacterized protein LOC119638923 [Glossina fuscipes]